MRVLYVCVLYVYFQQPLQVISDEARWYSIMPTLSGHFCSYSSWFREIKDAALVCFSMYEHRNNTRMKEVFRSVSKPALQSFVLTENHVIPLFKAHCE